MKLFRQFLMSDAQISHQCSVGECKKSSVTTAEFVKLFQCNHKVCKFCLQNLLVSNRKWREDPTASFQPNAVLSRKLSLFEFAELPDRPVAQTFVALFHPPVLCKISCPVPECDGLVQSRDVSTLSDYNIDWRQTRDEYKKIIASMKLYQSCCMQGVVCEDGPQPVSQFVQLGCQHYYHPACLAPALRLSIERERLNPRPRDIMCPRCVEIKETCLCTECSGEGGHVLTDSEIRGLVDSAECDFSEGDQQQWAEATFSAFMSRENERGDSDEQFVQCRCGASICTDIRNSVITCTCGFRMCIGCKTAAHEGTCEEARQAADSAHFKAAADNDLVQTCPFCDAQWDRPMDCLHVTCEMGVLKGGCGQQFCFLCAAPWTPILSHGNAYHREGCDFREDCCDKKCTQNGGVCVRDKHCPGPCDACRDSPRHNGCTHSVWQACSGCKRVGRPCNHWCHECARLGRLCMPPGNPPLTEGSAGQGCSSAQKQGEVIHIMDEDDDEEEFRMYETESDIERDQILPQIRDEDWQLDELNAQFYINNTPRHSLTRPQPVQRVQHQRQQTKKALKFKLIKYADIQRADAQLL